MNNLSENLKQELANVDIGGVSVKPMGKHPKWKDIWENFQESIGEVLSTSGEKYSDLANFFFITYPKTKNIAISVFLIYFSIWGFLLDDVIEKHPQEYHKWMKYLDERTCPDQGDLEKLFLCIIKTGKDLIVSPKLYDEFIKTLKEWLSSYHSYYNKVKQQIRVTDEEYIDLRLKDAGICFIDFLIKLGCGLLETDDFRSNADLESFFRMTGTHFSLVNDLFSLKKEVQDDREVTMNYVLLKMKNYDLSPQQAVDKTITEIKECEQNSISLGNKLKLLNNEVISNYVEQLTTAMYGNIYWSATCKRYNNL